MGEFDRIRWHCRRGLLELDIILARFLDGPYASLTPGERDIFSGLLELADNDLWDMIAGRSTAPDPGQEALLEKLRQA